ncbi:NAD(P)-dependent oxidoreductase [Pediococcus argentinicus]|uniref:D-3-phosphoglycerate dehydrogenase n=1 Tax=Pediococcus argentinicus TaxID=480391 RepID=A0A0R2NDX6_9LACO|nr:NAD(P)-dependent oxidoreductase [Pediococcus argentinicus]KRO24073.1 D-3-phosphoglycerate dehydrogenase [Pediococcus argentinicus]GEP19877.1 2-hydroxyacid dehydrogenase [Pediococcus argentinicus]
MKNIYIADQIAPSIRTNLPTDGVQYWDSSNITPETESKIDIVWGSDQKLQAMLKQPNQIKWIQSYSAGVDYFPLETLKQQNIALTNTSGIHSESIAESVAMYALYFSRQMEQINKMRQASDWSLHPSMDSLQTLSKMNWLIFGTGHIGSQIAKIAQAFGGHTIGVNHSGHAAEYFNQNISISDYNLLAPTADIVVNILPLTTETTHFYNYDFFQQFKHLFLFINVGRGKSVHTEALQQAIHNGNVDHAALDVFETEPLPQDSILWSEPNILITPHNSAVSHNLNHDAQTIFIENLRKYLNQEYLTNEVDLIKGY